jgi:hypothetical protein
MQRTNPKVAVPFFPICFNRDEVGLFSSCSCFHQSSPQQLKSPASKQAPSTPKNQTVSQKYPPLALVPTPKTQSLSKIAAPTSIRTVGGRTSDPKNAEPTLFESAEKEDISFKKKQPIKEQQRKAPAMEVTKEDSQVCSYTLIPSPS